MNFNDIESRNEIFAFESSNWNVVVAKKEIFDFVDAFYESLKNSFASYSKNIEISIAMNMFFLEYFINENNFDIEVFYFAIEIITSSKNSSIQQIEHSETLKKNSIYIELFAFSVFDFNIDIDFEIYTIDSTIIYSSTQFSIASFSSFISSITIQIVETITNYEKKQFICFANSSTTLQVIEKTSNYERKQFNYFANISASISTCTSLISSITIQVVEKTSYYEKKQIICFTNIVVIADIMTTKSENVTTTKHTVTKSITKIDVTKFVVNHVLLVNCLIWIQHFTLQFCMII